MTAPPTPTAPPPLGSLFRKAAVDAGFDLEPEIDGAWWRLRASGVPGVAWVHPAPPAGDALLALPLAAQLAELGPTGVVLSAGGAPPSLPLGAAGVVACATPLALHAALRRVWSLRAHGPQRLRARWEAGVAAALGAPAGAAAGSPVATPMITEVVAEVRRRVGQDLYREALLDFWEGRCAITGLAVPELLRASHAKPWAVATDAERLDVHNGLLLAVHLDALFDRGFLTFEEDGSAVLSQQLSQSARETLGVGAADLRLTRIETAHQPFLAYHRAQVFKPN